MTLPTERGINAMTLADVARAAGVSRQAIYLHYANRTGLLLAMARYHDNASGFVRRVKAARDLPPVEGLVALLRAWCDYIPEILPVAQALEAAAITGDGGEAAWHDRMHDLREAFRIAVDRVARDGRLAEGWSVQTATDWAWARSHLTTWQHLVRECAWSPADYADRCTRSILAEIVTPAPGNA